jgi:hypothetical protein
MTLMADEGGLVQMGSNPLFDGSASKAKISVPLKSSSPTRHSVSSLTSLGMSNCATYKRSNLASIKVEDDTCCMMGNWVLEESVDPDCASSLETPQEQRARGLSVSNYYR